MDESPPPVVLPIYLVLDTSQGPDAHQIALALVDEWAIHPTLSDRLRLAVLEFGSTARAVLPMCDPLDADIELGSPLPGSSEQALADALDLLAEACVADVRALRAAGLRVHRPLAFLVISGNASAGGGDDPGDDPGGAPHTGRDRALAALRAIDEAPTVVPLGWAGTDLDELAPLADDDVIVVDPQPEDAIGALATTVVTTVVETGYAVSSTEGSLAMLAPDRLPTGVRRLRPG